MSDHKHGPQPEQPQPEEKGRRLDVAVRQRFDLSWRQARQRIQRGQIWIHGEPVMDIGFQLAEGVPFEHVAHAPGPGRGRPAHGRPALAPGTILAQDRDLAVVDKPAGMLTMPFHKDDRGTLDQLLAEALGGGRPGKDGRRISRVHVVHRLDRNTSGLLVFARTSMALDRLKDQFREHTVHRRYLALVEGHITSTTVTSHLVQDRGDGRRGSLERAPAYLRKRLGQGKIAITHVEALERLTDATIISCQLETGRTNQIRIHLAELGHPLIGETTYRRGLPPMKTTPLLCLHAAELGFAHPRTGEPLMFNSEFPAALEAEIDARR